MASLGTCSTCNQQIAKSADACPHCGADIKHDRWQRFLTFLFSCAIAWFVPAVMAQSPVSGQWQELAVNAACYLFVAIAAIRWIRWEK